MLKTSARESWRSRSARVSASLTSWCFVRSIGGLRREEILRQDLWLQTKRCLVCSCVALAHMPAVFDTSFSLCLCRIVDLKSIIVMPWWGRSRSLNSATLVIYTAFRTARTGLELVGSGQKKFSN
jgi:hypothetical protein